MNTPNRQRWLVIAAATVVGLLILDRLLLTPLTAHWDRRTAEIARLGKSLAGGRGIVERADRTHQLWNEIQAGALPFDPASAEQTLLSAFDQWGRTAGIELGSIKPQWKRGANPRYSTLECRIDASGTLATLTRFLYEVEKSPLALRIDSVELAARDDRGQKLSLGLLVSGLRFSPLEAKP